MDDSFEGKKVKKLLFMVNTPEFFLSHRLPLALAARDAGFSVHISTGAGCASAQIVELGFAHHFLPLSRSGKNPFNELRSILAMCKLMYKLKPTLVHLVTIKPVLYGGILARILKVPGVIAAISGLGSVFVVRESIGDWLRFVLGWVYRLALRHRNIKVIFQNVSDQKLLVKFGAVTDADSVLVKGSGVALPEYPVQPEPDGVPVVTFASRLLKDKGVMEFVDAARILRKRGMQVEFRLVGAPDPGNPTSVTEQQVMEWGKQELVKPLGFRTNVADLFAESNLVVLPSYYGEGLPKVLIEAAACGRAVITTEHPGCRDAIEPDITGLLVPVRDAVALANAVQTLIEDPIRRKKMGQAGRALAEREFSVEMVVDSHLAIYQELIANMANR